MGRRAVPRSAVREGVPGIDDERILGEPVGRDTINAVGLTAAVLHAMDPDAIFAVLTADHLIVTSSWTDLHEFKLLPMKHGCFPFFLSIIQINGHIGILNDLNMILYACRQMCQLVVELM